VPNINLIRGNISSTALLGLITCFECSTYKYYLWKCKKDDVHWKYMPFRNLSSPKWLIFYI